MFVSGVLYITFDIASVVCVASNELNLPFSKLDTSSRCCFRCISFMFCLLMFVVISTETITPNVTHAAIMKYLFLFMYFRNEVSRDEERRALYEYPLVSLVESV